MLPHVRYYNCKPAPDRLFGREIEAASGFPMKIFTLPVLAVMLALAG